MNDSWSRISISDLCTSITDCVNRTAPTVDYQTPFRMIRTSNIKNGWIDVDDVKYVSEEIYRIWTRREIPQPGDVILTREAPLGEVGIVRGQEKIFLGQRLISYRTDRRKLNPFFLYYSFLHEDLQNQVKAYGSGSTVEHMRVPDAKKLSLCVPSLTIQNKIVSILSAYDDLIENNNRRLHILEEMAQAIYREWFINFRYPGNEMPRQAVMTSGLLIPEGWQVVNFSQAVEIDPTIRVDTEIEKPYIDMGKLSTDSMVIQWDEWRTGSSGSKFCNKDVLFPRITPCLENGKGGFVQCLPEGTIGIGSTEFIVFREKLLPAEYIYLLSRDEKFRVHAANSMVGASGRQRVRKECFDQFSLPIPPTELLQLFKNMVDPMFRLIQCLSSKNYNLQKQRNNLLPRLVSGEVDIENLFVDSVEST